MKMLLGLILISVSLAAASTVMGCAPAATAPTGAAYAPRVIIKFSDAIEDPADSRFVHALSIDAGVTLDYLRPMSGSAHVYEVRDVDDATELADALRQLAAQAVVIYAEEDRVVRKP